MRLVSAVLIAAFAIVPALAARAQEQKIHKAHAIAMHGGPKYGPDFEHFDYVNPAAPKGGTLRVAEQGTFDSFNGYIPKGNAAVPSPSGTKAVES